MPNRSFKLKSSISCIKAWLRSGTRASKTDRGRYQDEVREKDKSTGRPSEIDEPPEPEVGDAQVEDVDEDFGRDPDMEWWVARCEESVLRTRGHRNMNQKRAKEGEGKVEDGVAYFVIKGIWRQLPGQHWAWKPLGLHLVCPLCQIPACNPHRKFSKNLYYECTRWSPVLLHPPGSVHIEDTVYSISSQSMSSHSDLRHGAAVLAARIPPELFPLLYGWADPQLARMCRLVCRHWEEQCREYAFASINSVSRREERVLDLARFKHDPAWQHLPPLVKELWVPDYTNESEAPWLHLLDPRWCSNWYMLIKGPFPGHRTIRSIHFALPRPLPRSFSRGITLLALRNVNIRRFEDTACLVSELPDLERLDLESVTWESLLAELPRRRPRTDRNKLRQVEFARCGARGTESPSFLFAGFTLFPAVYAVVSLSADVVATIEAVLHALCGQMKAIIIKYNSVGDTGGYTKEIVMDSGGSHNPEPILALRTLRKGTGNDNISIFIDLDHEHIQLADHNSDKWARLNTVIGLLHLRLLLGFHNREQMLRFSALVVDRRLPSTSTRGEVQYTIRQEREWGAYWYQASLESEALHGEGTKSVWKVYP